MSRGSRNGDRRVLGRTAYVHSYSPFCADRVGPGHARCDCASGDPSNTRSDRRRMCASERQRWHLVPSSPLQTADLDASRHGRCTPGCLAATGVCRRAPMADRQPRAPRGNANLPSITVTFRLPRREWHVAHISGLLRKVTVARRERQGYTLLRDRRPTQESSQPMTAAAYRTDGEELCGDQDPLQSAVSRLLAQ